MLLNYFKTALRNLIATSLYSSINLAGLCIGLTVSLLLLIYVDFEKSYDRYHPNYQQIYRLRYERTSETGEAVRFASSCPPAGLHVRKSIPEAEKVARLFHFVATVSNNENKFLEECMFFAEPDIFNIFYFHFLDGNPQNAIQGLNKAAISQSVAKKYFCDQNPIGQVLSIDKKNNYQVTAVFEDNPVNSHLKMDILLSYDNLLQASMFGPEVEDSWGDSGWYTYILFKQGFNIEDVKTKIAAFVEKECGEMFRKYNLSMELPLQPLTDIHLNSHFMVEHEANGDADTVYFLQLIAVFVLLIAWVNYINLSTARSLTRAREVGLRKVVGASRGQIMSQFIIETGIINLIAVVLSVVIVELLLPIFSHLTDAPLFSWFTYNVSFVSKISLFFILSLVFSGLYPVIVMSGFQPMDAFRGQKGTASRGFNLRKALVVFQYFMAIGLLTFTFAVYRQVRYMKNQNLGISIEKTISFRAPRVRDADFDSKMETFRHELLKNPMFQKLTVSTEVPGRQIMWDAGGIHRLGTNDNKNYQIVGIDYDYIDMFGAKLLAGRNFSKESPSDITSSLILNETAVKWMGFESPDSAIGGKIDYWGEIFTVVGVLKDFHQQSLKQAYEPHIFRLMPSGRGVRGFISVKMNTPDSKAALETIQKQYDSFFPGNPFVYFFLEDYYNQQYKPDERFAMVFLIFSVLSIFVTLLGIFGLTSFMVVQRSREISIRKILGSGIFDIIKLFSREIFVLVIISFAVSVPVCYYSVSVWLQGFANHPGLNVWLFIWPLAISLFITALTIGALVLKACFANPIQSLRYE